MLEISHAKAKSASQSSNLTFFGIKMTNKRPHSETWVQINPGHHLPSQF